MVALLVSILLTGAQNMTEQEITIEQAENRMRAEYWQHVRELAQDIIDECKDRMESGEEGEELRNGIYEYLHETIDGDGWVIYTAKNLKVLLFSDNDGAYIDNYGSDGLVKDGQVNWAAMAYAALEEDVKQQCEAEGFDWNDPENSEMFQADDE